MALYSVVNPLLSTHPHFRVTKYVTYCMHTRLRFRVTIDHNSVLGQFSRHLFPFFSGFMVNLCSVALQLCDSFLLSKGKDKYKQIEALYCTSKGCRLRFTNERMLAGGHIGR